MTDVTLEVKLRKMLFNNSHKLKIRIYRDINDQSKLWDLEAVSTSDFTKLTDDVIFIPGTSFNFMPYVEVEIKCVQPSPKAA